MSTNPSIDAYTGAYPHIKFNLKTGIAEAVGASDEENAAFNKRLSEAWEDGGDTGKRRIFDKVELGKRMEFMQTLQGTYVAKKPMPKNAIGLTATDRTHEELLNEVLDKLETLFRQEPMDKGKLKELLSETFESVRYHLDKNGYTSANDTNNMRQAVTDTYNALRRQINQGAYFACRQEGLEKYPTNFSQGQCYYNADYYYKVEDVKALLEESAKEFSDKYGFGEPDLSQQPIGLKCNFYNFNSCWSGWRVGDGYAGLEDYKTPPPKSLSFVWKFPAVGNNTLLEVKLGNETWRSTSAHDKDLHKRTTRVSSVFPYAGKSGGNYSEVQKFLNQVHIFTPSERQRIEKGVLFGKFTSTYESIG